LTEIDKPGGVSITPVTGANGLPIGSSATDGTTTIGYSADQLDNQLNALHISGNDAYGSFTRSFSYDGDDNLTSESDSRLANVAVNYAYTAEGQIFGTTLQKNGATIASTQYGYDQNTGLGTSVASGAGAGVQYHYIDVSALIGSITTTAPGGGAGPTTTYSYLPNTPWVSSETVTSPSGTTLYSITYTRDGNGKILTSTTGGIDATGSGVSLAWSYGYDGTAEVTTADASSGGTAIAGQQLSYAYDPSGNRMDQGSISNVDQYSNYTYNARGDLTNDGTFTYAYDPQDRLISTTPNTVTDGSVKTTFGYVSPGASKPATHGRLKTSH
jgi:YD repeat-containing protein